MAAGDYNGITKECDEGFYDMYDNKKGSLSANLCAQGSTRSPQWTGGGVVFAPTPRDYSVKMNKKEKQLAMKSVLTSKVNESKFIVLDELKLAEIKTKQIKAVLDNLKVEKALIVTKEKDDVVVKSANNLPKVATTALNNINVYDILKYDTVVVTSEAVAAIEEVYA